MRLAIIAAAVIAATVDVLYALVVIPAQHAEDPALLTVPFVAGFIALMAACAGFAWRTSSARLRPLLLGIAAAGLLLLGFFAMFSIGLPLVAAGVLLLLSLIGSLSSGLAPNSGPTFSRTAMAITGCVLSIAVLLGGLSLAEVTIRCPARGQMGGGGITVAGISYSYNCDNGKLTLTR